MCLNSFRTSLILCSFIGMIPLGLRKSFALAPYTLQFVYLKYTYYSRKLTVSPNLIFNEYTVTSAQKGCKWHFGQNSFFALTGVYGQDTLSEKVLHLDFV